MKVRGCKGRILGRKMSVNDSWGRCVRAQKRAPHSEWRGYHLVGKANSDHVVEGFVPN